jgi:hypothetical protein
MGGGVVATQLDTLEQEATAGLAALEARATSLKLFATVLGTAIPAIGVAGLAGPEASSNWRLVAIAGLLVLALAIICVFFFDRRDTLDVLELAQQAQRMTDEELTEELVKLKLALYNANADAIRDSTLALYAAMAAAAVVLVASATLLPG